jgi:hypothetical protein
VKSEDAGTKFFHANVTIRHRHNTIISLQADDGEMITSHEGKANLLWESYKKRLGTSEFTHIYFDLQELLARAENLEVLEKPFTKEEIDAIIKDLPIDKSPGTNGFNSDFLKNYWPTVCQEYYKICQGFYAGNICMLSINGSRITLVPKIDNSTRVGDYRPISLLIQV